MTKAQLELAVAEAEKRSTQYAEMGYRVAAEMAQEWAEQLKAILANMGVVR